MDAVIKDGVIFRAAIAIEKFIAKERKSTPKADDFGEYIDCVSEAIKKARKAATERRKPGRPRKEQGKTPVVNVEVIGASLPV